jgi:PST family polysaccharide transporter
MSHGGALGARFLKGSFYLGAGNWLTYALNFALSLVLARLLGPDAFGFYAFVLAVNELLNIITGFSIQLAVVQAREESQELYDTALAILAGLGALALVGAGILAPFLAAQRGADAAWFILAFGVFRILTLVGQVGCVKLERGLRYGTLALMNFVSGIASNLLAVACAWGGAGVWSLLARDGSVATFTLAFGWLASGYRFRGEVRRATASRIMDFAKPMFAARALEIAMVRADRLAVGTWLGDRLLGLYDRSAFLAETGALALRPVSQLAFNLYSRLQEDPRRLARAQELVSFGIVRVSLAGGLTLAVFPEATIRLLLGPEFADATPILRWLAIYSAVLPIAENLKMLLLARGRAGVHARIRTAQLAVLAPGVVVAARSGSATGVAALLVATWILGALLAWWAVRDAAPGLGRILVRPLFAAAATGGALVGAETAGLLAGVPGFALPFLPPVAFAALLALLDRGHLLAELRYLRDQLRTP